MFSLSYSAAYDPYHTVFRFLALLTEVEKHSVDRDTLRICDFYLCFPWFLHELSAPRTIKGFAARKNAVVRMHPKTPYDVVPEKSVLFDRMEAFQSLAWESLVAKGLVESSNAAAGLGVLVPNKIPNALNLSIKSFIAKNKELMALLSRDLPLIPYHGESGLKHRSGLMEYRYDNV